MDNISKRILITEYKNTLVCIVRDKYGRDSDIFCEPEGSESLSGNIYAGRTARTAASLNAAFVEYLPGREGFFLIDDNNPPVFADPERKPGPLKGRERIMVQVSRDAEGTKEPALSAKINIPGRYAVFTSARSGLHFSSKFHDTEKKEAIKERFANFRNEEYGFIIRTNAASADIEDIFKEIDSLISIWERILADFRKGAAAKLLYRAPGVILSCIRDLQYADKCAVITDLPETYDSIRDMADSYPDLSLCRIELYENRAVPFDLAFNASRSLSAAAAKKVYLKSGGYLVIEPTEALVSIDVNSGQAVSGKNSGDEFLRINTEAAVEAARQIRLRNLSGIIIIDFINMKTAKDRGILMDRLSAALSGDPQRPVLVDMTPLGLAEITRKKNTRPLYEMIDI